MQEEYDQVVSSLRDPKTCDEGCNGWLGKNYVLVTETGIGKVNAAMSLTRLLENISDVDKVISIGCAGAVAPSLNIGDIVVGNSYCYHDVWCGEPNACGQIQGYPSVFPSDFSEYAVKDGVHIGAIASGDWIVQTREKAEAILNYLPSLYNLVAVDMESTALAQVCSSYEVPFVSLRVISDNPLLPKQGEQYNSFWDNRTEYFDKLIELL